jgi:flagellar biosynthesis protein
MSDPSQKNRLSDPRKAAAGATPDAADALRALPSVNNIAVALRHDRTAQTLPRIVASGRGAVAEQIVAVAQAQGIRVSKDADLAEVLVALEVGSDIPVEAFAAVAEILSYIYRANQIHGAPRARTEHTDTAPSSPASMTDKEA